MVNTIHNITYNIFHVLVWCGGLFVERLLYLLFYPGQPEADLVWLLPYKSMSHYIIRRALDWPRHDTMAATWRHFSGGCQWSISGAALWIFWPEWSSGQWRVRRHFCSVFNMIITILYYMSHPSRTQGKTRFECEYWKWFLH